MNNNISESNNNKRNVDLEELYDRYFANPKEIDKVYNQPEDRPYLAGGIIGGFVFDKTNIPMHNIENIIQKVYYRLPCLSFPGFFDVDSIRPDLKESRKQEINEIYEATAMMLSDIDQIKNIDTKKRVLYYCKTLARATHGCEISNKISVLTTMAEQRNNIIISNRDKVLAEKRKDGHLR